jgi:hypothetical protein
MIGPPLDSARGPRALPGRPGSARRGERGGISWVSLLLIVLVLGGGYLAVVWVPVYYEAYAVKQVVRDYMNQAIKDRDDEGLRRNMILKIRSLDEVEAVDVAGRTVRVPAVDVDERRIVWERRDQDQPPTLRIAFAYERRVVYPLLDRTDFKVFEVDLTGDLTRADWGPAR